MADKKVKVFITGNVTGEEGKLKGPQDLSPEDAALVIATGNGYPLEETAAPAPAPPADDLPPGEPSDDWKADQLEAYCNKNNITVEGKKTKANMLEAITKAKK